jgi:Tfp pilus assembly protein PilV
MNAKPYRHVFLSSLISGWQEIFNFPPRIMKGFSFKGFSSKDESGFTLAEILVAMAIIMVGLLAVMQAFPLATQAMDTGRRQSTAAFLAQQKIEEIRAWSLAPSPRGFANMPICSPCTGAAPFNVDGFNTIPGYADYSRTVIVQNGPSAATTRLIQILLSYRRVSSTGVTTAATQVRVESLIAQR